MMNSDKWIGTLPKTNQIIGQAQKNLDPKIWVNTLPKPKAKKKSLFNKYSVVTTIFVIGLILVSFIKNETRSLQKELSSLQASIKSLKFDIHQSILDYEFITSPENISRLAKENLEFDLVTYKKFQIQKLVNDDNKTNIKVSKNNNISGNLKLEIKKKIKETKTEIKKLKELYSKPEEIPGEVKTRLAKKIEEKKTELKNLYHSPKETITLEKAQRWAAVQFVKIFLGMPIIPGK